MLNRADGAPEMDAVSQTLRECVGQLLIAAQESIHLWWKQRDTPSLQDRRMPDGLQRRSIPADEGERGSRRAVLFE